ncbi:DUF1212 domain membrane protein Prm10 [Penicillium sp. IBT 18751x]|nr:DUF1212 domain membrane protein Prm10 [Penicillium sp. IBT 18751x]
MFASRQSIREKGAVAAYDGTYTQETRSASNPQYRRYIERLCRSLMKYGGPLCVLEEFLEQLPVSTIDADHYLHLPSYMLVDWSRPGLYCEPEVWKEKEGIDLQRLYLAQDIHKSMKSGILSIDEASRRLDRLMLSKSENSVAMTVIANGISISALTLMLPGSVLIDTPVLFGLGSALGLLRHHCPHSPIAYNLLQFLGAPIISLYRFYLLKSKLISLNASSISSLPTVTAFMQALAIDVVSIPLCGVMMGQKSHSISSYSLRIAHTLYFTCMLQLGGSLGQSISVHIESSFTGSRHLTRVSRLSTAEKIGSEIMFIICTAFLLRAEHRTIPFTLVAVGTAARLSRAMTSFLGESCLGEFLMAFLGSFLGDLVCQYCVLSPAPIKLSIVPLLLVTAVGRLEQNSNTEEPSELRLSGLAWVSSYIMMGLWLAKMVSRTLNITTI